MYSYRQYLDFAKRHLRAAEDAKDADWLLVPAVVLAWIAIESFINSMVDDFASLPEDMFLPHERAFMLERKLVLAEKGRDLGKFVLDQSRTDYRRVEERIFFLIGKFGRNTKAYKGTTLWQDFVTLKDVRNRIAHPRKGDTLEIRVADVADYIETAQEIIKFVSTHVWGKSVEL
jgi:hypothetical protein